MGRHNALKRDSGKKLGAKGLLAELVRWFEALIRS